MKISKEQENRDGKPGFRSCFPLAIGEVKKIQSRRWIEIKFKNIGKGECIILLLVCVTTKDLPELSR